MPTQGKHLPLRQQGFHDGRLIIVLQDITFKDFYFDRSLLRQIKRSHQTEWRADSSEVDVREGDEEGENENENETEIETALKPKDEEGNDD